MNKVVNIDGHNDRSEILDRMDDIDYMAVFRHEAGVTDKETEEYDSRMAGLYKDLSSYLREKTAGIDMEDLLSERGGASENTPEPQMGKIIPFPVERARKAGIR